ncbi:DUF1534 domain-containing protein [Pseudomonas sp. PA-5-4G]|nr:DUF1534 domain-containing protein [Pseudomonas sp. PA-5-4H]MCF5235388.1 DUF1534 domain-containing protein [Pseudomonas sp. PA-5-4G]MCF5250197.1 DUF1534 domain-containing protein [Pseudomonas sp. PA-5-4B]MCF5255611.1 DUF1534 domain-containing protein [Pseudomonas sp. PA-5-4B]MCF5262405.1 DUF1534 domain-containing protein [Pseudomonas sp. PA-5-4A]
MKIVPTLPCGNASCDALRHRCARLKSGRGASLAAFPRRAWERSLQQVHPHPAVGAGLLAKAVCQPKLF